MKSFELYPIDGRKSFYGKARVFENDHGAAILKSYDTDVCMIDARGEFHRLWSGESATTMRHVSAFLYHYGIDGGGVAWWRRQTVENFNFVSFYFGKPIPETDDAA